MWKVDIILITFCSKRHLLSEEVSMLCIASGQGDSNLSSNEGRIWDVTVPGSPLFITAMLVFHISLQALSTPPQLWQYEKHFVCLSLTSKSAPIQEFSKCFALPRKELCTEQLVWICEHANYTESTKGEIIRGELWICMARYYQQLNPSFIYDEHAYC